MCLPNAENREQDTVMWYAHKRQVEGPPVACFKSAAKESLRVCGGLGREGVTLLFHS